MATMTAIDLGAASGRVAVGRFDGTRLQLEVVHRFPNRPVRLGDALHWNLLGLYREVLDGLRAAGRSDSIGVDAWAVDFGLIDRRGRLLGNPVHYRDRSRAAAFERVLADVPAPELFARTGIRPMPINTLFELAALAAEDDPALRAADTLLMIPDLVHHWLARVAVGEWTNATTTQCLDVRDGSWATDLLDRLGIPVRVLPELVQPGTALGPLAQDVAREIGMRSATVVAVGTHDTASAVAAVPLRRPASAYISSGTWSLVGCERPTPLITDASCAANLTNEGGVGGTFRVLRNITGLWLLQECRRAWAAAGHEYEYDELVALAEQAPPGSLIDPDDPRFASPGDMPARIREACLESGQTPPDGPAVVTRCILESLALKHAEAVAQQGAATGVPAEEIHVVGGGARNTLLCRWTAAAAGLPVVAGPEEATLIGNVIVQAMALGELGSLAEAREVVRSSFAPVVHEPEVSSEWQDARERFAAITTSHGTTCEAVA